MSITVKQKQNMPRKRSHPPLWLRLSIGFFMVVFMLGGFYASYLFYATVREIVARTELPALPMIQLPSIRASGAVAQEVISDLPPQLPITLTQSRRRQTIWPTSRRRLLHRAPTGSTSCCWASIAGRAKAGDT